MSVTINTLGPNSRQIVINNETSADNIINALNTSLTALGWTLVDSVSSGVRNCVVKKVYSAPNADSAQTPTTKYMILRFDAPKGFWYVTAAEYWDVGSHTATNETFHNNYAFPMSLQYSNNVIYVFASARYAAFATAVRSEVGPWQGVFEFEREAPEDIAGQLVPCFGWTSAQTIGNYYGSDHINNVSSPRPATFWVPRTINGYTGWGACQQFIISTAFGMFPPPASQCTYGTTTGYPNSLGMLGAFGVNSSYAWDSGKKVVSSLKLGGSQAAYNTGRVYGLKVTPNFGAILDTTTLPVDTNGFFNTAGTNANHYLFPISGGASQHTGIASNRMTETTFNSTSSVTVWSTAIVKGRYIYAATSAGVYKLDQDTAAWTAVSGTSGTYNDVVFDGTHFLYFATASGIVRMDIEDDSVTFLAVSGGVGTLAIDDDYIYAGRATTSTTPVLDIIDIPSFAVVRSYTSSWTAPSANACTFKNLEVDYQGNVYARLIPQHYSNSGTYQTKAFRIVGSTAVGAVSPDITVGSMYINTMVPGPSLYDFAQGMYWSSMSHDSTTVITVVAVPSMNIVSSYSANSNNRVMQSNLYVNRAIPFKGYYWSSAFSSANTLGGWFDKTNDGSMTITTNSNIVTHTWGGSTISKYVLCTDGVFVYACGHNINQFSRIGGQSPGYNSAGSATARVLFKA